MARKIAPLTTEDLRGILLGKKDLLEGQLSKHYLQDFKVSRKAVDTCELPPKWLLTSPLRSLWENTFSLPKLSDLGSDQVVLIKGGITSFGARYPSFTISALDVSVLSIVLTEVVREQKDDESVLDYMKSATHQLVEFIQSCLMTNTFNSRQAKHETRWNNFDTLSDVFRNNCLHVNSYMSLKSTDPEVVPTSVCLLPLLFGDCREHNILLHVMVKLLVEKYNIPSILGIRWRWGVRGFTIYGQ
jgi:hypothetical protein